MSIGKTSILLTNDDGLDADGLRILAQALEGAGEITVVAPRKHMSATSHAISLYSPVHFEQAGPGRYAVHGTPVDCVVLALHRILRRSPDLIVSGINHGNNMGQNVFYSGTVAAAMEGTFHGIPSVAVSLAATAQGAPFETAALFMRQLADVIVQLGLPAGVTLNVNVPGLRAPRGVRLTHRAHLQSRAYDVTEAHPSEGRGFWIRQRVEMEKVGHGSDFAAVREGYISVTPLTFDVPEAPSLGALEQWLRAFEPVIER